MDDLKILQDIGVDKISHDTYIEKKDVRALISKDFEKLSHIKVYGFLSILEREYGIDLSLWKTEYKEYLEKSGKDIENRELFIVAKPDGRRKKIFATLFILLLLFVIAAVLFFPKESDNLTDGNMFDYQNNPIIIEAKKKLEDIVFLKQQEADKKKIIADINSTELNTTKIKEETLSEKETKSESIDTIEQSEESSEQSVPMSVADQESIQNISQTIATEENKSVATDEEIVAKPQETQTAVEQNIESTVQDENGSIEENSENSEEQKQQAVSDDLFMIEPNSKVWVGIVYLDNYKKASYLQDTNVTFDSSKDQIIATGHGDFDLYFKGTQKKFFSKDPVRFLYKEGELSEIDKREFIRLNRGENW